METNKPRPSTVPGYIANKDAQLNRLRRIEGQIRGLQRTHTPRDTAQSVDDKITEASAAIARLVRS